MIRLTIKVLLFIAFLWIGSGILGWLMFGRSLPPPQLRIREVIHRGVR